MLEVWKNFSSRFGIYTLYTQENIPDKPGVYAWFVPLYMYGESNGESLDEMVSFCHEIFYGMNKPDFESFEAKRNLPWEELVLSSRLKKSPKPFSSDSSNLWQELRKDEGKYNYFRRVLMEASLFLPPLYVGKTKSLKTRYGEHISDSTFCLRFNSYAEERGLPIRVQDLLYVTIALEGVGDNPFRDERVETLLEGILHRISMPPFSKR